MLAYLYVIVAVLLRFLPHQLNFTPVAASLVYFGARRPLRQMWAPVALLAASDVLLTTLVYRYPLTPDHLVSWLWYAGALGLGTLLRRNAGALRLVGASLAASVSFFLLSNFAVWLVWQMYPKTLAGLAACYVAALPFFRNSVAGDLVFTAAFFGMPALAAALSRKPAGQRVST